MAIGRRRIRSRRSAGPGGHRVSGGRPGDLLTIAGEGTAAEREQYRYDELDDMVSTVGSGLLGLTTGCARCHDHKFDPIPTRDYYRLAAVFRHDRAQCI